jgi:hypothetical protein
MQLQRRGVGVHDDHGHAMGRFVDVKPTRDELRLRPFGDLGEVADASLQLVELALLDLGAIDVDDGLVHASQRLMKDQTNTRRVINCPRLAARVSAVKSRRPPAMRRHRRREVR